MILVAWWALSAQSAKKVDAATLEFYQGTFVVREGTQTVRVPIESPSLPDRKSVAFRRNDAYAVWDGRGLTIRHGNKTHQTKLEQLVVNPKLFTRDEILKTLGYVRAGRRRKEVAALSGAVRIGQDAFFLARWEERGAKPWAEVLLRVSLKGKELWPTAVGRFSGLSLGYRPLDDRLFIMGGKLAIVARKEGAWGVSTYDPASGQFEYQTIGADLTSYLSTGKRTGLFVEKTAYGTTVAGRVDLIMGFRKPLFEARTQARFVDTERPSLLVSTVKDESRLIDADTGAQVEIPLNAGIARAGSDVLVWYPAEKPRFATLYAPDRWTPRARWAIDADKKP